MSNISFQFPQATTCCKKQNGSALMMTLFIIIVLVLLGGALMRVLSTSSEAIAQEVIGTRAYMAANSAMQAEDCPLTPSEHDFSASGANIDGLYHCGAEVTCTKYATNPVTGENFFRLTSTGKCGSSELESDSKNIVVSSRTIQVEARSLP